MLLHMTDTQGVGVAHFRHVSLRNLNTISMERSAGSCEWSPGERLRLEGAAVLRNLDKHSRRDKRKGKNRERREGDPFLRAVGRKRASKGTAMEKDKQEGHISFLSFILIY